MASPFPLLGEAFKWQRKFLRKNSSQVGLEAAIL